MLQRAKRKSVCVLTNQKFCEMQDFFVCLQRYLSKFFQKSSLFFFPIICKIITNSVMIYLTSNQHFVLMLFRFAFATHFKFFKKRSYPMKYVKLGFGYTFKHGWYLCIMWLLPAIFLGLCCEPFQIIKFLNVYSDNAISNFADIFKILMPISWKTVIFGILAIVLVSVCLSMAVGQIESHMRSGKLNFKEVLSYVNENILVTLANILVAALIYIILTFLLGAILFLFHLMLSGLSNAPTVLNMIFASIFCAIFLILFLFAISLLMVNIPNMIANGYSFKEGISSSVQLIGKNAFKIVFAYLVPFVVVIPFVSLLCKTNVAWIANILCSLIIAKL